MGKVEVYEHEDRYFHINRKLVIGWIVVIVWYSGMVCEMIYLNDIYPKIPSYGFFELIFTFMFVLQAFCSLLAPIWFYFEVIKNA